MRVLIADDDEFARRMLQAVLTSSGYQVVTAKDGEAAWQILLAPDPPRLLLLDGLMPKLDGLELCRKARTLHAGREAYIILVTAKIKAQDVLDGLEAGADDFISKPVTPHQLLTHVRRGEAALAQRAPATQSRIALRDEGSLPGFIQRRRASAG